LCYLDPVRLRLPELVTLSLKVGDDNDINDDKLTLVNLPDIRQ